MSAVVKTSGFNLARATQATASEAEIVKGFTAWVNGELLTGTATPSKTLVLDHTGDLTHTFTFDAKPKAVLVQFGYNGAVGKFGTFMKILDIEYMLSSGSPSQSVAFGETSVTAKFLDSMSSSYTPYIKVTAIF